MTERTHGSQIVVVEASAGSGKTYALTKKFISLLLSSDMTGFSAELRTILAITFTNKAAIEMKARILTLLKQIAFDDFPSDAVKKDILGVLELSSKDAQKRANNAIEYIFKHYNHFQVETIDSFINGILKGCSAELDVGARFAIKDDIDDILRYSFDEVVDAAGENKDVRALIDSFLRAYVYIESKSNWYPKEDIISKITQLYYLTNTYGAGFEKFNLGGLSVINEKREFCDLLKCLMNELPEETNATFRKTLHSFLNDNDETFTVAKLSRSFRRKEFPIKKNAQLPDHVKNLWASIHKKITTIANLEALSLYNPYIDIFNIVSEEIEYQSRREDAVFLPELNHIATRITQNRDISVPELYYRIATRLNHYLIDEFQDTSILQWNNLNRLIDEALPSGGSLFYVGDKKQAIYRFRGGEAGLFDAIALKYKQFAPSREVLSVNYRSCPEIVACNNVLFSKDNIDRFFDAYEEYMREKKEPALISDRAKAKIAEQFIDATQSANRSDLAGTAYIENVKSMGSDDLSAYMKATMLELIPSLTKRHLFSDIAILVRDNEEVRDVTEWLLSASLPVQSEKTLSLRANAYVKELMALLKFLDSPIDNLSFSTFLTGNIFRSVTGYTEERIEKFLLEMRGLSHKKKTVYFYREFEDRFNDIWKQYFEELFKSVGFVPLYEFMISILSLFKVIDCAPQQQGYIMRLLEIIKEQEEERTTLASFIEFFESADSHHFYVATSKTNAITVLTVHKAKGLEFPVVVVPFIQLIPKVDNLIVEADADSNKLRLIRIIKEYGYYSATLRTLYEREYVKSFIDEINNLYVSLTRAKTELYGFVPNKKGGKHNFAQYFVPEELYATDIVGAVKKLKSVKLNNPQKTQDYITPSRYKSWIPYLKDEFIDASEITNRSRIIHGEVLHLILSFVKNLTEQDKNAVFDQAMERVAVDYSFVPDQAAYRQRAERVVDAPHLRPMFYLENGDVFTEFDVITSKGHTKRLDRLIVREDRVCIVDFKSSQEGKQKYHNQVREYMSTIGEIYQDTLINGYIVYLDTLELEPVKLEE